jgi:CRISPR-associated endonuclease/helicase Cas3
MKKPPDLPLLRFLESRAAATVSGPSSASFGQFFLELHGYPPFPWQQRLAEAVARGEWPEALSLPTGVGKTSIIDVWAWARTAGLRVPTRLFYIIDRRLVVDSVADQADRLARHLDIVSAKMRGGMLLDDTWVKDPTRPTIIVSTIDQAGSRLLFRGYGVSSRVAPIHAALVAHDSLLVIDEAHLSPEFIHTLSTIRRDYHADLRILEMTATPEKQSAAFELDRNDFANPLLKARLTCAKPARLIKATPDAFVAETEKQARSLRSAGQGVVGVVVNRVADARALHERLRRGGDAVLLTGRIRDYDRQVILDRYLARMISGSRAEGRDPLYIVATQTIEVGADLDFDALVTESTDLSGLKQRFGRLNRLGDLESASGVIVHRGLKSDDPGYRKEIEATWKWLGKAARKVGKDKVIDFGISALAVLDQPVPERVACPTLTPVHVRALAHTSPPPQVDIHPFLHGWEDNRDLSIVWRADLTNGNKQEWAEICEAVPPVIGELLPVPVYEAFRWLNGRTYFSRRTGQLGRERPQVGDVLFVPAGYGGCDAYGWNPGSKAEVTDLADRPTQKRLRLRFNPLLQPELAELPGWDENADSIRETAKRLGVDARLHERGLIKKYPGGCIIEHGLWAVQPSITSRAIELGAHQLAVGEKARALALEAGLPETLVNEVCQAAEGHDIGKDDPAFQLMLGGTPGRVLAKGPGGDDSYLPKGWRHEMLSAARADGSQLVRYLIGTHHGHGRGMLPASPDSELWRRLSGLGWGELFFDLNEQYGPWGLAYMESITRLADWLVSEEEQR